jgi:hypothetical protein
MTARCEDLDGFFDGELAQVEAVAFRAHLASCDSCQHTLHGRMQEERIVQMAQACVEPPRTIAVQPYRRRARSTTAIALGALLAAAAVLIWLLARPGDESATQITEHGSEGVQRPKLSLALMSPASTVRGSTVRDSDEARGSARTTLVHPGDVVRLTARGGRHSALWVYRGTQQLVTTCPGSTQCMTGDGEISLDFDFKAPGQYWIIALGGSNPVVVPNGHLDAMLSRATSAGTHFEMELIDVN